MGIAPKRIASRAGLLVRDPNTLNYNFLYLTKVLGLKKSKVQNFPSLLSETLDAFAKKMRVLKLDILELKRGDEFDINNFSGFYVSSPATLRAKKQFCVENSIEYKNILSILTYPWRKIIKRVDKAITDYEAEKEGKEITQPFKKKYDKWMTEYKKWAKKFTDRRGRRLITKI